MIFLKTEEQFSDLLDELKTEFNWNDGQLYSLPPNSIPNDITIVTTKDLER